MSEKPSGTRKTSIGRFEPLIRSLSYVAPYKGRALVAYALMALGVAAMLAVPQIVQIVLDSLAYGFAPSSSSAGSVSIAPTTAGARLIAGWTGSADAAAERILLSAVLLIVIFAILQSVFAFAQTYLAQIVSQYVAFDMRNDLFARIQGLSFSYHDRNQTGQLMIRATSDVGRVRLFLGQGLLQALQALLTLVGALLVLTFTDWRLTAILLPLLPVMLVLFSLFATRIEPLFGELQRRLSHLNTFLQENIAGMSVVRAFVRERWQRRRFDDAALELMRQEIALGRVYSLIYPAAFLLAYLCQVAIFYLGGSQVVFGQLTLGEWQKFLLYLVFVFVPIGTLGIAVSEMSQASVSARRIFQILDTRSDVVDRAGAILLGSLRGSVEFEHVTFRYFVGSKPVLSDVSFKVRSGQTVALLGATGSGKTTIINLIPRFYDASEGRVLVDGHDVRDITLASLRRHIGIVLQETTLFRGSIRENIAFGCPDAQMDAIIAAAEAAAAHDFIMEFPDGYETRVGERGVTLSGGQKQRIAIARALLMNPGILILDDATSSVDIATEAQIQRALQDLMVGRTSFVIAQRISTVQNADLVLVLKEGRIVAEGQHEELLEISPEYADLYYSQLTNDLQSGNPRSDENPGAVSSA